MEDIFLLRFNVEEEKKRLRGSIYFYETVGQWGLSFNSKAGSKTDPEKVVILLPQDVFLQLFLLNRRPKLPRFYPPAATSVSWKKKQKNLLFLLACVELPKQIFVVLDERNTKVDF